LGAGDISKVWGIAYRQETLLIVSSAEKGEHMQYRTIDIAIPLAAGAMEGTQGRRIG
jgi:hypothetical protein